MKKKLKGMSLMEIIVSLAIYGVLALLITEIMTCVNATMRATRQLNKRLAYETKFADNLLLTDHKGAGFQPTDIVVQISYKNGTETIGEDRSSGSSDDVIHANEYTAHYYPDEDVDTPDRDGVNYRFMRFVKTPAPPTGAPETDVFTMTIDIQNGPAAAGSKDSAGEIIRVDYALCDVNGNLLGSLQSAQVQNDVAVLNVPIDYQGEIEPRIQTEDFVVKYVYLAFIKQYDDTRLGTDTRADFIYELYPAVKLGSTVTYSTGKDLVYSDSTGSLTYKPN